MTRTNKIAIVCAAVALVSGAPALAESSSWFQKSDQPARKKSAPAAVAKPATTEIEKTVPSTVAPTGDDAAYTAFDQIGRAHV